MKDNVHVINLGKVIKKIFSENVKVTNFPIPLMPSILAGQKNICLCDGSEFNCCISLSHYHSNTLFQTKYHEP